MNDKIIAQKLAAELSALHVTPQMRTRLFYRQKSSKRYSAPRLIVAVAMLLMLVTACAYAAGVRFGILDFIGQAFGRNVPRDANQYITKSSAVFSDERGMFSVHLRQMAFDGSSIFSVMDITPKSKTVLILPSDSLPENPISDIIANEKGTIQEYCERKGYTDVYRVSLRFPSETDPSFGSEHGTWCEDSFYTLFATAQLAAPTDAFEGALEVILTDCTNEDKTRIPCSFSLTKAKEETVYGKNTSITLDNAGIIIDRVELEERAFETWFTVFYTVIDETTYNSFVMGVDFRLPDENGKALPAGASGIGITELLRGSFGSMGAMYRSRQSIYMPTHLNSLTVEVFCPGESEVLNVFRVELD